MNKIILKIILPCVFILLFTNLFGQTVEIANLEREIRAAKDETQVDLLIEASKAYRYLKQDSALSKATQAKNRAIKLQYIHGEGMALNLLGEFALEKNKYRESIEYFLESEVKFKELDDDKGLTDVRNNIGQIYLYLNDNESAFEYFSTALEIYLELNVPEGLIKSNINLGDYYLKVKNNDKAIEHFNEALSLAKENKNKIGLYYAQFKLGIAYMNINDTKNALENFTEALNLAIESDIKYIKKKVPLVLNNFGDIYSSIDDLEMAIYYYNNALDNTKAIEDKIARALTQVNIGKVQMKRLNYEKALEFFNLSRALAWETDNLEIQATNLKLIASVYEKQENFLQSIDFYKQYITLADSLLSRKQKIQEDKVKIAKLIAEKAKDKEIVKQQIEINKLAYYANRNERIIYFLLVIIFLMTIGFMYLRFQLKRNYSNKIALQHKELQTSSLDVEKKIKDRTRKLQQELVVRKQVEVKLLVDKKKIEEANRMKTAYLSNVSHDLRTPLNAIMGFAGLLRDVNLPEEKRIKYIEHINYSADIMHNMLNQIIDVSRIETNTFVINEGEYYVNRSLDSLLMTFKQELERKGVDSIELRVTKAFNNSDFSISTDGFRIEQVLSNLVRNALTFTEKGFVELGYKFSKDNMLEFYVQDTGIGIRKEKVQAMFDRFEQIHHDKTKIYSEEGLGLPISMNIIELLGGEIRVEAEPGKGSTFFFTIPYKPFEKEGEKLAPKDLSMLTFNWTGKTILIAEDIESNFKFLEESLAKSNANIIRAHTGKEAVDLCKSGQKIDLILMDLQMPELDGYEATKQIKAFKKKLPIIAQTAFAMANERVKSMEAGCDDYISKPIKENILFKKIAHFLNK